MSQDHLSYEQIQDLLDGSLPVGGRADAEEHLASCAACAEAYADQQEVALILAEDAAEPLAMPPDVFASVEAALTRAARERTAGVPSIDDARARRRTSRTVRWVAGAAAAVAVVGIGTVAWQAVEHQGSGPSAASNSVAGRAPGQVDGSLRSSAGAPSHPPSFPAGEGKHALLFAPRSTPDRVADQAEILGKRPSSRLAPRAFGCAAPLRAAVSSVVKWDGHYAVLAVYPATRTATVYDCRTAVNALYTTGY